MSTTCGRIILYRPRALSREREREREAPASRRDGLSLRARLVPQLLRDEVLRHAAKHGVHAAHDAALACKNKGELYITPGVFFPSAYRRPRALRSETLAALFAPVLVSRHLASHFFIEPLASTTSTVCDIHAESSGATRGAALRKRRLERQRHKGARCVGARRAHRGRGGSYHSRSTLSAEKWEEKEDGVTSTYSSRHAVMTFLMS